MHALWFYKHQHNNRVRSKLSVARQRLWFQWRFWYVPSVPGYLREEEEHKPDPWRNPIERNHMGLHLEIGLLKPRQSFRTTMYSHANAKQGRKKSRGCGEPALDIDAGNRSVCAIVCHRESCRVNHCLLLTWNANSTTAVPNDVKITITNIQGVA